MCVPVRLLSSQYGVLLTHVQDHGGNCASCAEADFCPRVLLEDRRCAYRCVGDMALVLDILACESASLLVCLRHWGHLGYYVVIYVF